MKPTFIASLVASSLLAYGVAGAQDPPPPSEPTPPPGDAPPTAAPAPQPTTQGERQLRMEEEETTEAESDPEVYWGIGARSRFITTPKWLIELFVDHATTMQQVSFAGEVIRRKGNFDIVISLEYARVAPEDGLYQEKGEVPNQVDMYPDFYNFDSSFAFLSADVSFIWHFPLTDFMAFRVGPGVGIGIPLGGWENTDTMCDSTTMIDDLDDPNQCQPIPGTTEEGSPPPVMPVVNLLAGLRFKIVDQLSINVEAGWRMPAFFVGGGIGYFF
jgi:hypothetical protein